MKSLFKYTVVSLLIISPLRVGAQNLSAFADLLYWKASEETSSFWSSDITFPAPNTTSYQATNIDFEWNAGFRGGLASKSETNFLDAKLYWTHFQTHDDVNHAVAPQVLTPEFFSGFLSGNFFFGVDLDWQFVMNMIDFELSHGFNPTPSLCISPTIGIKGAAINQTINSQWNAVIFTATEEVKHRFRGVGPSFGVDGKWQIYDNLSLIGDFSAALLWGDWDVTDTYTRPSALGGLITPTTITSEMNHAQLGSPMVQYFVGFEWARQATENIPGFKVHLGYEMQYWANQLRVVTFQILPVHGDLTLQGATCGISIEF